MNKSDLLELQVYGITNFLPIIFQSLDMSNDVALIIYCTYTELPGTIVPLLTGAAVHTTVGTIFVLISILLVDRFGRRTLFRK